MLCRALCWVWRTTGNILLSVFHLTPVCRLILSATATSYRRQIEAQETSTLIETDPHHPLIHFQSVLLFCSRTGLEHFYWKTEVYVFNSKHLFLWAACLAAFIRRVCWRLRQRMGPSSFLFEYVGTREMHVAVCSILWHDEHGRRCCSRECVFTGITYGRRKHITKTCPQLLIYRSCLRRFWVYLVQ